MADTLFDPTIHLRSEPLEGYKFDFAALVDRIEALKKNPNEKMLAFLADHPEYKEFNSTALAEYCGLSEPALKKLKRGQTADPRGSTFWILYNKFGIRPREVLKCVPAHACMADCTNQARHQLQEAQKRIAEFERQQKADQAELARLRKSVLDERTTASAATADVKSLIDKVADRDATIKRQDKALANRNKMIVCIIATILMLFVLDLCMTDVGWIQIKGLM